MRKHAAKRETISRPKCPKTPNQALCRNMLSTAVLDADEFPTITLNLASRFRGTDGRNRPASRDNQRCGP